MKFTRALCQNEMKKKFITSFGRIFFHYPSLACLRCEKRFIRLVSKFQFQRMHEEEETLCPSMVPRLAVQLLCLMMQLVLYYLLQANHLQINNRRLLPTFNGSDSGKYSRNKPSLSKGKNCLSCSCNG